MGEKPHQYQAGFRTIGISNAGVHNGELVSSVAVWYPSLRKGKARYTVRVGEWFFEAERNAKPALGRFPVILLSHGMAGHNLANYDLALALARRGFVVIAPTHYGDNSDNASAIFSAALYYHRPRQLTAALHKVTEIQDLRDMMDLGRLGVLGSGSGAVTALQLAGADLDPAAAPAYCAKNPQDPVFCNAWAASRQARLPAEAAELRAKFGPETFRPSLARPTELVPAPAAPAAGADVGVKAGLRVGAVGLLTPGGLFLLEEKSLAALQAPLGAVFAEKDEFYPVPAAGDGLGGLLPAPLAARSPMRVCPEADHYSLAAPCPEVVASTLPGLCGTAGTDQRQEAARERDDFFISFFRLHLGLPMEIEAAPAAQ